jgi:flagellar assembly factor FliW
MQIQTSRFGSVNVAEDEVISFPQGLVGFESHRRFALLAAEGNRGFYWLQALDDAETAFLVTDPDPFFKDYDVPIREETQADLHLADTKDGRVLVICNRSGDWLTGNLLGPLVINTANRIGSQVVVTEKKWTCRQPLLKLEGEVSLAKAA